MKSQVALSMAQMIELETLGINTADASLAWVPLWKADKKTIAKYFLIENQFAKAHSGHIPAYTLEDLLRKMPTYIPSLCDKHEGYILRIGAANPKQYYCSYEAVDPKNGSLMVHYGQSLMDCVFVIFKGVINHNKVCENLI